MDTRTIRNGFLSDKAKRNIVAFQAESAEWMKRLYIDTRSDINGRDLFVSTRRAIREHGVNLVVVDYLQLMSAVRPSDSRVNDVAEISRWVKRTAKDLNVAVVALAQLGRESVKVKNARPTMADLRESGQIEQDADIIGLLYRPDLGREPDYDSMSWIQHHEPWCPKENSGWFGEKITLPGPQGHRSRTRRRGARSWISSGSMWPRTGRARRASAIWCSRSARRRSATRFGPTTARSINRRN